MNPTLRVGLIAMAIVWATACKTIDPMVASGEVMHDVTREVIDTGAVIFKACEVDHTLGREDCLRWATFVDKFKKGRALAIKTWRFAVLHEDAIEKGKATDIILALSAELGEFTSLALALGSHQGPPALGAGPTGGDL